MDEQNKTIWDLIAEADAELAKKQEERFKQLDIKSTAPAYWSSHKEGAKNLLGWRFPTHPFNDGYYLKDWTLDDPAIKDEAERKQLEETLKRRARFKNLINK